ncbi:HlyD family type I secretion periplasmic adaptor subunit [Rhizobium sp. Rhizsp82]|uniref:HlyD family type I secretion periplasmic adaptor subunit n=1 Tax=Rhizobium sp. Rhizsp82 TaxID=3243057 RepID=UPI0039B5063C
MNAPLKVSRYSVMPLRPATRSDHEFLAPALEVLETPPSPIKMALITVICAFTATALIWSYLGKIDIIATGQGKIQPTGRVKVVQPLLTGKVTSLPPQNGTLVHAGEVLLKIDPTDALADEREASKSLASLEGEIQRRHTVISYVRAHATLDHLPSIAWAADADHEVEQREDAALQGDLDQHYATMASLLAQMHQKEVERDRLRITLDAQQSLVDTLKSRVEMRSSLVSKRAGTLASVMDATEALKEQATQFAVQQGQLAEAEAAIDVLARERDRTHSAFINDQLSQVSDAERKADEVEQRLAKAKNILDQMTLRSPVDGIAQMSTVTSLGQVVTGGQEVLRIVPEDGDLELEVYMPNKDIGFIKVGQEAVVKLEAFPFTRYGTLSAQVMKVARDAIPEPDAARREGDGGVSRSSEAVFGGAERIQNLVFPVTLRLADKQVHADGASVDLSPGMAATAEVRTGQRRILEYVFSPLVEVAEEAMHER